MCLKMLNMQFVEYEDELMTYVKMLIYENSQNLTLRMNDYNTI